MQQLDLVPYLENLVEHETDIVQTHAAKALWAIRDHKLVVECAEGVVARIENIRKISERYR